MDDLLGAASKHLNLLRDHDGGAQATLQVAFEVHSRKGRLLLCLQVRDGGTSDEEGGGGGGEEGWVDTYCTMS